MIKVFIGVDERQPLAYTVAAHSVAFNSSKPVQITPLIYKQLPVKRRGLTTFTFTRYLVPWLCEYKGVALFMDADTICRGDVAELWDGRAADNDVCVVTHADSAMHPGFNLVFERTSVMLFNCERCEKLTPEYIENGKPHTLEWAKSIGKLPHEWNHLVGYDAPNPDAKLVHFTQGIPCFAETCNDEHAASWQGYAKAAYSTVSWEDIMGKSVHAMWKRSQR
jgi:lipopolysaccharide biosynthesis glycosyltransferase